MRYFIQYGAALVWQPIVANDEQALVALSVYSNLVKETVRLYRLDRSWSVWETELAGWVHDDPSDGLTVADDMFARIGLENAEYEDNAKRLERALERVKELESAIQECKNNASTTMERALRRAQQNLESEISNAIESAFEAAPEAMDEILNDLPDDEYDESA